MGIDPKIALPVIGRFIMKEDVCGYSVAINILSKSLNYGIYIGYAQYDLISKLRTSHANVYGHQWMVR